MAGGSARRPYRWVVLATGTGAQTVSAGANLGAVGVLAPWIERTYHAGLGGVGIAIAATNLGLTLTYLGWGVLADRFGERRTLVVGLAGGAVALAGAALSPIFAVFVLTLVLLGATGGSATTGSARAVMHWFPTTERGVALGIRHTALPGGAALAALILPAVADSGGLQAALLLLAAAHGLVALASGLLVRDLPVTPSTSVPVPAAASSHPLRNPRVRRLSTASALLLGSYLPVTAFTVVFFTSQRGVTAQASGVLLAAAQVLGSGLRIGVGAWSDRRGVRLPPLVVLSLAMAAGLGLIVVVMNAPLTLLMLAWGAAAAVSLSWNGLSFTAVAEMAGLDRSGTAMGIQQTFLSTAAVIAPLVFSMLVDRSSWQLTLGLFAIGPLFAFLLLRPMAAAERASQRTQIAAGGRVT